MILTTSVDNIEVFRCARPTRVPEGFLVRWDSAETIPNALLLLILTTGVDYIEVFRCARLTRVPKGFLVRRDSAVTLSKT